MILFRCLPLALALAAQSASAQTVAPDPLNAEVQSVIASHHGRVALYAEDMSTHKVVAVDADVPVQTASVIKLAMLYEALEEIRSGKARWDEKIVLKKEDQVGGSGVLPFLDTPLQLTLRDVLTLMITLSDNTATNLAIDRFGLASVNARMEAIGLRNTHFYKKVFKPATEPMPEDQKKFGLGKTTAREMAHLITRFSTCQLSDAPPSEADKQLCSVAIEMLRHQFYRDCIPRYLETLDTSEEGTAISSKSGSLNAVRNDVALIGTKHGLVVISGFTYDNRDQSWQADNEGELTLARLARAIIHAWAPDGLNPKTLETLPAAATK